jgi:transcriptional regulator with XRE-family HTH domain
MTLAELCGTSTSYIGQIEIGNRFPSLELIEKIANALQIRPHMLFFIESDEDTLEQSLQIKTERMTESAKEELIKRLTDSIRRIIKRLN